MYQDICAADNERPIWRSRLLGAPMADPMVSKTQFGLAVQNPVRVQRVANVSPTGPERAVLCRACPGDAADEHAGERGVVRAEPARRVWVAL